MKAGGNKACKDFLKQHDCYDLPQAQRWASKGAEKWRQKLRAVVEGEMKKGKKKKAESSESSESSGTDDSGSDSRCGEDTEQLSNAFHIPAHARGGVRALTLENVASNDRPPPTPQNNLSRPPPPLLPVRLKMRHRQGSQL